MFEMNIPNTWWCDIETEVSEEGFPDPEEATTRINTISMTQFPRTIIWARKDLTLEEQEWVQKSIDEYSEKIDGSQCDYNFVNSYSVTKENGTREKTCLFYYSSMKI